VGSQKLCSCAKNPNRASLASKANGLALRPTATLANTYISFNRLKSHYFRGNGAPQPGPLISLIEGDASNSHYWYSRTTHSYGEFADVEQELAAIKRELESGR
jgi:hypothetical protein